MEVSILMSMRSLPHTPPFTRSTCHVQPNAQISLAAHAFIIQENQRQTVSSGSIGNPFVLHSPWAVDELVSIPLTEQQTLQFVSISLYQISRSSVCSLLQAPSLCLRLLIQSPCLYTASKTSNRASLSVPSSDDNIRSQNLLWVQNSEGNRQKPDINASATTSKPQGNTKKATYRPPSNNFVRISTECRQDRVPATPATPATSTAFLRGGQHVAMWLSTFLAERLVSLESLESIQAPPPRRGVQEPKPQHQINKSTNTRPAAMHHTAPRETTKETIDL